jgi:hypothetical protein
MSSVQIELSRLAEVLRQHVRDHRPAVVVVLVMGDGVRVGASCIKPEPQVVDLREQLQGNECS